MKTILKTLSILMIAAMVALAAGCSKSGVSNDLNSSNNGGNNGGGGGGTPSIPTLISKHVNASASCYQSDITIRVSSTLNNALPDKTIKYGVEYGYLHEYEWETDDYVLDFNKYLTKNGNVFKTSLSFFIVEANWYEWPFGYQGAWYQGVYEKCKNKINSGQTLDDEEWELYYESQDELWGLTRDATDAFCGLLYVEVDYVRYYYKRLTTYGDFNDVDAYLDNNYPSK